MARKNPKPPPAPPAPPPPPPTKAERKADFVDYLDSRIRHFNEKITVWHGRLVEAMAKSPELIAYYMSSMDGAYEAASFLKVFTIVREALTKENGKATLETVADYAKKECFRYARYARTSSSALSNLEHTLTGAAWAEMAEDLASWVTAPTSPDPGESPDESFPD